MWADALVGLPLSLLWGAIAATALTLLPWFGLAMLRRRWPPKAMLADFAYVGGWIGLFVILMGVQRGFPPFVEGPLLEPLESLARWFGVMALAAVPPAILFRLRKDDARMNITIRNAGAQDVPAIDALLRACFPTPGEALLVQRLCIDGDMVLAVIAEDAGQLVGVAVFSRMQVEVDGKPVASVALAPAATTPSHRRQGIAEAMILSGHRQLSDAKVMLSFVLGDPDYYESFDYAPDWAKGFDSPYAGEYFMALPLQQGAMPCGVRGRCDHAAAFAMLGSDE